MEFHIYIYGIPYEFDIKSMFFPLELQGRVRKPDGGRRGLNTKYDLSNVLLSWLKIAEIVLQICIYKKIQSIKL